MLERIGKYEIRAQLGRGGMGIVYEGFDSTIQRRVAIKTLRTELIEEDQHAEFLARFKREAQSAGRLSHPHIVTIHEFGEHDGMPYIVMEYISGRDLAVDLKRGKRFALDDVVHMMTQLLGALSHAHERGVIHRDIKPQNVLLLEDGSLKVVDFGIARIEEGDSFTKSGVVMGTPAYMAPEQILALPATAQSDIFSAGTLLYQLLTGDRPFTGDEYSVKQKVLKLDPMPPSELNPTLAAPWDAVVSRAMAKKPAARYDTALKFLEAIRAAYNAETRDDKDVRRKTLEIEEHAKRDAAEHSLRIRAAQEATVLAAEISSAEKSKRGRVIAVAVAVVLVASVVGATLYTRSASDDQAVKSEVARLAAEAKLREETEKRAKAEALARNESDQRLKLEADNDRRVADAKREAELVTKLKTDEERAKALTQKREDEEKRKTELIAKRESEIRAKGETEARAKAESDEKVRVEARANAEAVEKARQAAQQQSERVAATREALPQGVRRWVLPAAYPPGNFHTENLQQFANDVEKGSGGKLKIQVHPSASLFKAPEIKRAVQGGQAQIGEILLVNFSNEDPMYEIDGIPFLATSYAEANKLARASRKSIEDRLGKQGMALLYSMPWPPQGIYSKRMLNSVADMKGLKWRAYSPATAKIAELVNAQPVTIQAAELAQALATGVVDSFMSSGSTGYDTKTFEHLKFFADTQAWLPKNAIIMNKNAFNALDKATQDAVMTAAAAAEPRGWKVSEDRTNWYLGELRKQGMTIYPPSAQLKADMRKVGDTMISDWARKAGLEGHQVIDAYRRM